MKTKMDKMRLQAKLQATINAIAEIEMLVGMYESGDYPVETLVNAVKVVINEVTDDMEKLR